MRGEFEVFSFKFQADVAAPFASGIGVATSPSPRDALRDGNEDVAAPFASRIGVATPPSPRDALKYGNGDVAAPLVFSNGGRVQMRSKPDSF